MAAEVGVMNGFMAFYERVVDEEALGGWRRRREKEKELAREVARMRGCWWPDGRRGSWGWRRGGTGLGLSLGTLMARLGRRGWELDVAKATIGFRLGTTSGWTVDTVEAVSVITTDTEKHDQTPQMIENKTEKEKETQKEKAQLPSPLEGGEERVKFDIRVNTTANGAVIAVMNVVGKEEDTKARPPTPPAAQTSRSPTPPGIKRAKKGQEG
ncbi:hypothetical protein BGX38DRAFT_1280885 [Terfezia claveryi]|nr:hypothetical protein BGX38DRAFT_1280885 [Terfezia claveryi]